MKLQTDVVHILFVHHSGVSNSLRRERFLSDIIHNWDEVDEVDEQDKDDRNGDRVIRLGEKI